jgi:uncharacterized OB-fold protein
LFLLTTSGHFRRRPAQDNNAPKSQEGVAVPPEKDALTPQPCALSLIEFPDADGIRLLAAIVETRLAQIRIGAQVKLGWSQAANARVPVFSVLG